MENQTNTDYIYAVSRIRAVERSLLDSGKLMQIADAKTPEEALRMMLDAGYPSAADYEQSLAMALDETYRLLEELAPDSDLLAALYIGADYYNLKVLLKAEFLGRDLDYLLNPRCKSGVDTVKAAVLERRGGDISEEFGKALQEALDSFAKDHSVQLVDMLVDRASYLDMVNYAEKTGNEFLIQLFRMEIDLINLQTMFRLRKIGKGSAFAKLALLEGGTLDIAVLLDCVDDTSEAIVETLAHTAYGDLAAAVMAQPEGSLQAMTVLETLCTDRKIDYIRKAKYVQFGAEPLIAYLLAKQNEIRQLRVIMVGKNSGVDSSVIKERLGASYV